MLNRTSFAFDSNVYLFFITIMLQELKYHQLVYFQRRNNLSITSRLPDFCNNQLVAFWILAMGYSHGALKTQESN
jgi:hypothetical protein